MEILFAGFGLVLIAALYIQARAHTESNRDMLRFLEKNMQIGGTPVEIVREQHATARESAKRDAERLAELRVLSVGD